MDAIIRDYQSGDEDIAQSLLRDGLTPYGLQADFDNTDADLLNITTSYLEPGGLFRFVECADQMAGMYGIYRLGKTICELRKMYLKPEYKGQGLGRLLMNDAINQARSMGFAEMILETHTCLKEAIGMYRKYGFEAYTPQHLSDRCNYAMRRTL